MALCHYASIENAERDQAETRKALDAFQALLKEAPGSLYAVDGKTKITQCWRRIAESELMVGIFYVKSSHFPGAERRIKGLLETYPEYADRERAYYYLGEAMRSRPVEPDQIKQFLKEYLARVGKDDFAKLSRAESAEYSKQLSAMMKEEKDKYLNEAKSYYRRLVESYPGGEWAHHASDRLVEMGQTGLKEDLDS
jgi:outer membrane protein assembly factor BamD